MALIFFDGFDGVDYNDIITRYDERNSLAGTTITLNPASPSGRAMYPGASNETSLVKYIDNLSTVVVGARVLPAEIGGALPTATGKPIFVLREFTGGTTTTQLTLTQTSNNALTIKRGNNSGTVLGTSANDVVFNNQWNYIELKAKIDSSTGGIIVRVNGVNVLELGDFAPSPTSLNTQNSGNAYVNRVAFSGLGSGTGSPAGYDDFYICDTTGLEYNDFLGDVSIVEIIPNAAGDSTQFTANTGLNWQAVDDADTGNNHFDGDATYVSSATAGHTDLYNLTTPVTSASTVLATKVVTVARKSDAGDQDIELLVKAGTTTSTSSPVALLDSYREFTYTLLQNPDTTANWTVADLTDVQIGFKVPV